MLARVIGQGENLSSEEAFNALYCLNEILDKWRIEKMMVSSYQVLELPLTGKEFYTIGNGGDIDVFRPQFGFESVYFVDNNQSHNVEIIQLDRYNRIVDKNNVESFVSSVYYQNDLETPKLYVIPRCNKGKLVITTDKVFDLFQDLDSLVSFPPAYLRAFRYALAVELGREYGVQLAPEISATAFEAKLLIKESNLSTRLPELKVDTFRTNRNFNIYTGE